MARAEKKVLLIDGDMRKPSLHKIFKLDNEIGLSTYLAGVSGAESLQKGPVPNLALMTSGPVPANPSELLSSQGMKAFLEKVEEKFDMVICDSPPLLSVTDALVLSHFFDGTMVIAKAKRTTFDMAGKALKLLDNANANVLGVVINGVATTKSDPYYHYYYASSNEEEAKRAGAQA